MKKTRWARFDFVHLETFFLFGLYWASGTKKINENLVERQRNYTLCVVRRFSRIFGMATKTHLPHRFVFGRHFLISSLEFAFEINLITNFFFCRLVCMLLFCFDDMELSVYSHWNRIKANRGRLKQISNNFKRRWRVCSTVIVNIIWARQSKPD